MRYAQIRQMDISNGLGIGVALFVQGCEFHCKGCFNSETWNFNGGKEFTDDTINTILKLCDKPYITRLSILGGEPLHPKNHYMVSKLCYKFKEKYPNKKIWLWTGYELDEYWWLCQDTNVYQSYDVHLMWFIDYLITGRYIEKLRNPNLRFRGSSNQKIYQMSDLGLADITEQIDNNK